MEKALVNKTYRLEKFPGKGGWTYAMIPEILQDKHAHFGWVRVRGTIDGFEIRHYHLMPMGNACLFLPVKAQIRKKIGKNEGDEVHVILYADNDPVEIPEDLLLCLKEEPQLYENFLHYPDGEQNAFVEWINDAKRDDTRISRLAETLQMVAARISFYDKNYRQA